MLHSVLISSNFNERGRKKLTIRPATTFLCSCVLSVEVKRTWNNGLSGLRHQALEDVWDGVDILSAATLTFNAECFKIRWIMNLYIRACKLILVSWLRDKLVGTSLFSDCSLDSTCHLYSHSCQRSWLADGSTGKPLSWNLLEVQTKWEREIQRARDHKMKKRQNWRQK